MIYNDEDSIIKKYMKREGKFMNDNVNSCKI